MKQENLKQNTFDADQVDQIIRDLDAGQKKVKAGGKVDHGNGRASYSFRIAMNDVCERIRDAKKMSDISGDKALIEQFRVHFCAAKAAYMNGQLSELGDFFTLYTADDQTEDFCTGKTEKWTMPEYQSIENLKKKRSRSAGGGLPYKGSKPKKDFQEIVDETSRNNLLTAYMDRIKQQDKQKNSKPSINGELPEILKGGISETESVEVRAHKIARSQMSMSIDKSIFHLDGFIDTFGWFHPVYFQGHEQANFEMQIAMKKTEFNYFQRNWLKVTMSILSGLHIFLGQDDVTNPENCKSKVLTARQKIALEKYLKKNTVFLDKGFVSIYGWGEAWLQTDGSIKFEKTKF